MREAEAKRLEAGGWRLEDRAGALRQPGDVARRLRWACSNRQPATGNQRLSTACKVVRGQASGVWRVASCRLLVAGDEQRTTNNDQLSSSLLPLATSHRQLATRRSLRDRRGFTLVELLITVAIIAILAGMILFAMFSAQETAKAQKTRALIAKLDTIIKAKWETYKTRRVPVVIPPNTFPANAARMRLEALRDLMRMELPDRWSDVVDPPVAPMARPAVSRGYLRRHDAASPDDDYQGAECLYLIVMASLAGDEDSRDVFKADNIGDVDNDGASEFVDGWGSPIRFLRWAPGFQLSDLQITLRIDATEGGTSSSLSGSGLTSVDGSYVGGAVIGLTDAITNPASGDPPQPEMFDTTKVGRIVGYESVSGDMGTLTLASVPAFPNSTSTIAVAIAPPDPFDPMGVHASTPPTASFALYPLIYSPGANRCYGIVSDAATAHSYAADGLNPFFVTAGANQEMIGNARNIVAEPNYVPSGWLDNIHNHRLELR